MSPAPQPPLTNDDLAAMIPDLREVRPLGAGGQKQVFRAILTNRPVAVKVMQFIRDVRPGSVDGDATTAPMPSEDDEASSEEEPVSTEPVDVLRLRREVGILRRVDSPHVVRLVPLQAQSSLSLRHHGNRYVVFAEELIDGEDLRDTFKRSSDPWPVRDVLRLGHDIALGIKALRPRK